MFSVIISLISVFTVTLGQSQADNSNCGQVFTKKQFILQSPLYPSNYPLNYECSYIISGPNCPTYFNLQLLDFNLENSSGCTKDRLEIEDLDALCGSRNQIKTYFSKTGTLTLKFISDNAGSGRGFRILITRFACDSKDPRETSPEEPSTTTTLPKWYTTHKDVEYMPFSTTIKPKIFKNVAKCCANFYSDKQFVITSPNFPYSMSSKSNCVFEITKNNKNVCRLRMHMKLFYLSQTCQDGFLKIDGKLICGCKSDLKLTSPFTDDSPTKTIQFLSLGNERNSYSGFVMEIIQDECPKRIIPEKSVLETPILGETKTNFRFYNDQINRVAWPNDSPTIEKLRLISENTEVLDNPEINRYQKQPKIVKHIYVFDGTNSNNIPEDREETTYIDTLDSGTIPQDNLNGCLNWNRQRIHSYRNLRTCRVKDGSSSTIGRRCVELGYVRGYFKSPGYPFYYPSNLDVCYR